MRDTIRLEEQEGIMIWKKDRLRPSQPFFVLKADAFFQEIYLRQGISHFYTLSLKEDTNIRVVPDGCIDLIFEYDGERMSAFAAGSALTWQERLWEGRKEYFGVRFMPGFHPAGITVVLKDLIDHKLPLEDVWMEKESKLLQRISEQQDFYQRIRIFLEEYTKLENKREKPFGKIELLMTVKHMVYDSDGLIKVSEMAEKTGYTERYINKVFIEQMGFSPKMFCKIIQFQRSLEFLNYGAPDKMTEAAVYLGFYDQAQFIKNFRTYAGITPKQYLKLIQNEKYKDKITNTSLL